MDELEHVAKAKAKDHDSIAVLINNHHGFIRNMAKHYAKKALIMDIGDFFNEGVLGLMDAVKGCDLTVTTKFLTYACWHIRNRMQRALIYKDWMRKRDPIQVEYVAIAPEIEDATADIDHDFADINFDILTEQEKDILYMSIIEGQKLAAIGRHFLVSREAIRKAKKNAIAKLQREVAFNQIIPGTK